MQSMLRLLLAGHHRLGPDLWRSSDRAVAASEPADPRQRHHFGVQTNPFGFIISWATNVPVVVEACTNLANPTWSPVDTNTLTRA